MAAPIIEPIADSPVFEPIIEPVAATSVPTEPSLLKDGERRRMDRAMAGLSDFRPVAEPERPTPRAEVDPLSSVSAADWSGLDGMEDVIEPPTRSEPVPSVPRREPVSVVPVRELEPAAATPPIPTTDPARGWVTADRLFSEFGD